MEPLPSRSALRRIGSAMTAGTETDEQLDQVVALLARCDDVQANATDRLVETLADVALGSVDRLYVRGRTKTLITLREKLFRMGGRWLPDIRDLAGLRIVGDMTLDEQDEVLFLAADALGVVREAVKVIDRRGAPAQGYRALHGEFILDGVRVELQVRTALQHEWAELNERAGDVLGRAIRYPPSTDDLDPGLHPPNRDKDPLWFRRVMFMRLMGVVSEGIAALETGAWTGSGVWGAEDLGGVLLQRPDPPTGPQHFRHDLLTTMGWAAANFVAPQGDNQA